MTDVESALPSNAVLSLRIILAREGPLDLQRLTESMKRHGYPDASLAAVHTVLTDVPSVFAQEGDAWSLRPRQAIPKAPRAPRRPVDVARQRERPTTAYPKPPFSVSQFQLKSGPVAEGLEFPLVEQRLRNLLQYGSYRAVTVARGPVGSTPPWSVHLMRLLVDDDPMFVGITVLTSSVRVQRSAALGWDMWPIDGRVNWRDDALLLRGRDVSRAIGTWAAPSAKVLAGATMHLVYQGMGCHNASLLSVGIESLSEREILRRSKSQEVRRVVRRLTARSDVLLGECRACGRPLTDRASADRGYGPDCWERLMSSRAQRGGSSRLPNLSEFLAGAFVMSEWARAVQSIVAGDLISVPSEASSAEPTL